ncbi:MAG: hypothetical protein IK133_05505 [Clostridia bacterium]|nr:hypothetical protein [Clostridia bacterium]
MGIKIALISTSQLSFPGKKEERFGKTVTDFEAFIKDYDAELYVYPETVITEKDAIRSLTAVDAEKPDFLLVQCTSFSAGFLAQVYGQAGYPLGFWAIPEGQEGGVMQLNSFCSINMYCGIVRGYYPDQRIPVKWFFGEVSDDLFAPRMAITLKAIKTIKAMCSAKVALIGGIAPGFNDLYFDERKLLGRFPGMSLNRLHEFSEIADRARSYKESELVKVAEEYEQKAKRGVQACSVSHKLDNARFLKAYHDFLDEYHYDALAISCWPKFMDEFDYSICSVVGTLNDEGIPAACEGDVLSAVSMLMLARLTGKPTMLMDMSAFDEKDDSVLMWHCGPAASCYCNDAGYALSGNYSGKAHIPNQPPICCGVARDMVFKAQDVTIGHLAGECDQLLIASGSFTDKDKPSFFGSRGWLENLKIGEKKMTARDFIATILDQGLSHHYPIVSGTETDTLFEIACRLNMKVIEPSGYKKYLVY